MTAAPDYAELVRRLRGIYPVGLGDPPEFGTRQFGDLPPIQGEAADAIESLAARVAELEKENATLHDMKSQREADMAYLTWEQGFKDGQHAASKDRNSIP